jgi:VCBS repeat-containing protein
VSITVNDPPVATNSSHSTSEDTPLTGQAVASDPDQSPSAYLAYSITSLPSHGAATIDAATGIFTYTPDLNFNSDSPRGPDSFQFSVNDGNASDTATITITVNAVNDDPVITMTAGDSAYGQTGTNPLTTPYVYPNTWRDPGATAVDVEDGNITPVVSGVSPDTTYPGKYQYVIYTATDSNSGSESVGREVLVRLQPPTISASASANVITISWSATGFNPQTSDPGYNGAHAARYNLYVTDPSNVTTQLMNHQTQVSYVHTVNVAGTYTYYATIDDGNSPSNYETSAPSNGVTATATAAVPGPWYISVTDAVTSPWVEGKLLWTDVTAPDNDLVGFKVYQSDNGGASFTEIVDIVVGLGNTPTSLQTEYIATGLTPSTAYQHYVVAYNASGNSANSNIAHYTTVAQPNGMQTFDTDEKGETAVGTATGIFYNGWGWTTTDPGSETDVTQWANVTMVTSGAMSSSGNFPAGAHEVWAAAVGWVTTPLTHHVQFSTYDGIHPTATVTLLQDNRTLDVAVPHSGIYDFTSLFYTIDYYAWTGGPGDSLASTSWIDAQEDANGDFTVDLGPTNVTAPTYSHGVHDLKVLGSYSEDGADEQAGATPVNLPFTRWDGIQDMLVPTVVSGVNIHDDGVPNNITLQPVGTSPDSPHGWRFSFVGPPLDGNGNQLTDLSNWGEFVIGEVTYTSPNTTHQTTISRAGTYTVWAQACWADGTPLLRMGQTTDLQWLSFGPFSVPQRAYGGLTDVEVIRDGDEVVITVTGDYHHWHYSVGQMFSGSSPNHDITGEGTVVSTGDTARYTPTGSGRQIIYVAGVDLNHALISASAGQQPVLVRILGYNLSDSDYPVSATYDPAAIAISSGFFSNYVGPGRADGQHTDAPVMLTSAQLSTELGFATEATVDAFIPAHGVTALLGFYASQDFSGVAFDTMVANQFVTLDNSILSSGVNEDGLSEVAGALSLPAPLVEFRIDALHRDGTLSFTEHQALMTGSTAPEMFSPTGGGVNNDEPVFVTATTLAYLESEINPTGSVGNPTNPGGMALPRPETDESRPATERLGKTTEWLYDNGYFPDSRDPADGTKRPYVTAYMPHYEPDHDNRGWKGWVNTRRIVDFVPDDPYLAGGFVPDPDIGSYAASDERVAVSELPLVPGPIQYLQLGVLLSDITYQPNEVLAEGDDEDWGSYMLNGGWMSNTLGVVDADQVAALQAAFDAEWLTDPEFPDNGQQRPIVLDPVLYVASWFDPQITLNQYGYVYQDAAGLGPLDTSN